MKKCMSLMRSDWLETNEKGPSVKSDFVSLKPSGRNSKITSIHFGDL